MDTDLFASPGAGPLTLSDESKGRARSGTHPSNSSRLSSTTPPPYLSFRGPARNLQHMPTSHPLPNPPPIPMPREGSKTPACTTQMPTRPSSAPFHPSRHSRAPTRESIPRRGAAHPERRVEESSEGGGPQPSNPSRLSSPHPTPDSPCHSEAPRGIYSACPPLTSCRTIHTTPSHHSLPTSSPTPYPDNRRTHKAGQPRTQELACFLICSGSGFYMLSVGNTSRHSGSPKSKDIIY